MAEIYCHINQSNASVQYFAILHFVREICKTENTFTLTLSRQNDATKLAASKFCRARESLCGANKDFSRMIRHLLRQYHKTLALCNI